MQCTHLSPAGLPSLWQTGLIQRLARLAQSFTRWWCSKFFRLNFSAQWMSPSNSSDAFRKLHTENEQLAIGKAMANLVVLEHHLWLNLTEIKDTDKMPHSPLPCLALSDGRSVEAGSVLLTQHMPK